MPKFWKQKSNATARPDSHRYSDHIKKQHNSYQLRAICRRVYPKNYEFKV